MHIVFAASECAPWVKSGGLGEVMGALPQALARMGHRITIYLPFYRCMREQVAADQDGKELPVVVLELSAPQGEEVRCRSVRDGGLRDGVQTYLIDCAEFFDRDTLYGGSEGAYEDNGERFGFYCRAVLEAAKILGVPEVFHAHDWQAALIPVYLRTLFAEDGALRSSGTVFTVHNAGYQGEFSPELLSRLQLPESLFSAAALENGGKVNLFKGGLVFADEVTTVSPHYAEELQTPDYGQGLQEVFRTRHDNLTGILNGVDYGEWNPSEDLHLPAHYSADELLGKGECRRALLRELRISNARDGTAVLAMVSRLASQKGFDLVAEILPELMREDVLLVIIGTGEEQYEAMFRNFAKQYPEKLRVLLEFDDAAAHRIVAGADIALMPSRYEPSGLSQLYSLRYGTVPVVRATGGLYDTVHEGPESDGFRFEDYSGKAFLEAIRRALTSFQDRSAWQERLRRGMALEFGWDEPAREYVEVYERAVRTRQSA